MQRLPDWRARLGAHIAAHRTRPFAYGEHDCATFAAGAVQAVTGSDPAPGLAGYTTRTDGIRRLRRSGLAKTVEKLQAMSAEQRAALPGVSESRASQLLAGAVVAHTALEVLGLDEVSVCPWALREGVILRRLDWLSRV